MNGIRNPPAKFHLATSTDPTIPKMQADSRHQSVMLKSGSYLVEFNETVDVPLDLMGQIFVRSSLFRSAHC